MSVMHFRPQSGIGTSMSVTSESSPDDIDIIIRVTANLLPKILIWRENQRAWHAIILMVLPLEASYGVKDIWRLSGFRRAVKIDKHQIVNRVTSKFKGIQDFASKDLAPFAPVGAGEEHKNRPSQPPGLASGLFPVVKPSQRSSGTYGSGNFQL